MRKSYTCMVHGANCIAIAFMTTGCNACWVRSLEPQKPQERKQQAVLQQTNGNTAAYVRPDHSTNKQALWETSSGFGKGVVLIIIIFLDIKMTDLLIAHTYY